MCGLGGFSQEHKIDLHLPPVVKKISKDPSLLTPFNKTFNDLYRFKFTIKIGVNGSNIKIDSLYNDILTDFNINNIIDDLDVINLPKTSYRLKFYYNEVYSFYGLLQINGTTFGEGRNVTYFGIKIKF